MSNAELTYPRPIYRIRVVEYASERVSRLEVDELKVVYENPLSVVIEDSDNILVTIDKDDGILTDYTTADLPVLLEPPHPFLVFAGGVGVLYTNEDLSLHPDWKNISTRILIYPRLISICRTTGIRRYSPLTDDQINGSCQGNIIKIRNIIGCDTETAIAFIDKIRQMVSLSSGYNMAQAIILSLNRFAFSTTITQLDPTDDTSSVDEDDTDDITDPFTKSYSVKRKGSCYCIVG